MRLHLARSTAMMTSSSRVRSSSLRSRSVVVGAVQTRPRSVPSARKRAGDRRGYGAPSLLFAPGQLGFGLGQVAQALLPFGFEPAGDQAVVGIDRAVAPFGPLRSIALALDLAPPLRQGGIAIGFELLGRRERRFDRGRLDGLEQGPADRLVDLHAADSEAVDAPTLDDVLAGAVVAGRGVGAAVVGAQPPAAMATGGEALEQRCPLSHGAARLVRLRSRIRANAGLVGFIGRPVDEALMVVGKEHRPLGAWQPTDPLAHDALVVDIALVAALAVGIGARVDGIGEHMVDGGVGRAAPTDLARRADLRGEGEVLAAQPEPDAADRAEFGEAIEDGADRAGDRFVGMEADLAIGVAPDQAHRQTAAQLAARGLVADAAVEASAQDVQLGFAHGAFEPQHQAIVECAG